MKFGNDKEHGGINGGTKAPGANRPKPSKKTPNRPTASSAEPAYGKGKKKATGSKYKRPHGRYS